SDDQHVDVREGRARVLVGGEIGGGHGPPLAASRLYGPVSMRSRKRPSRGKGGPGVAIVEPKRAPLAVPFAMDLPDRVRKERYYDPDFYELEAEQLWPRVWQMACRLEEIPQPNDFAEYEILDQSVIVVRTDDGGVRAFQNACRHRGVRVVQGHGSCTNGFVCPFHGWCYGPDGTNTHVPRANTFAEHNLIS